MNKTIYLITAILSLTVGAFLYQHFFTLTPPEHALHYTPAKTINDFEFTDHQGEAFNKASLHDNWTLVFFGYTSCPDICPVTLQKLGAIYGELKAISPNTQVVLMTVDPTRDTQEKLAMYIAYFNNEFKAVRGEHDQLFPFSRQLGLMYAIREKTDEVNYSVDHSASIALINPSGQLAAVFKPTFVEGMPPTIKNDDLVSDFSKIVAFYQ